jgi:hypothetical protein
MAKAGEAILLALLDYDPAHERDFNEWYNREHMRDRVVGLPGFLRGRRYISGGGNPKYAALYEAEHADSLTSDAYLELVRNPDDNSRRFLPHFIGAIRLMGHLVTTAGEGEGGVAGFYLFDAHEGKKDSLRAWLAGTVPGMVNERGIVATHVWEASTELSGVSKRVHLRRAPDRMADFVVMIEAAQAYNLAAVDRLLMGRDGLTAHGAVEPLVADPYYLAYRVAP